MTREKAVNELNDRIEYAEYVDSDYIDCVPVNIVKMAILALSVPETNVGDTISRKATRDAVMKLMPSLTTPDGTGQFDEEIARVQEVFFDIWQVFNDMPSVQPKLHWIPCSKKLPKKQEKSYWVCTDSGYQCQCRWTNINHIWTELTTDWHWHFADIPQYTKVVAWMPLPEPYKEEEA